ncbi:MAG TPA: hypothetical protein VFR81_08365 [Longimicrobium sp.]|nr:hypothetical protein [Longimicrobium sp.]
MNSRILGALIAAALIVFPTPGAAQAPKAHGAPTRVPVTVAMVERLPVPDAPFVVLRRTNVAPQDVILLPAGADARLLSDAVQMLLIARQAGGDTATAAATLRVRPQRGRTASQRPILPWAQRVLADLRRVATRPVEGVGTVPAVEIWLPPQTRRGAPR